MSTHRRPDVLARCLAGWAQWMPDVLVVNHDVTGAGVAATKNRGITMLMDAGCDHLLLCDDDCWPIADWSPYVFDPEPHLMHCWGKTRLLSDDGHYTTWQKARGVLLYTERRVIDRVGGMRLDFGRWGGEHREWSRRIHDAGFTKHPYADLTAARHGIWYCTDYAGEAPSTVTIEDRNRLHQQHVGLRARFDGSTDYVDYRQT